MITLLFVYEVIFFVAFGCYRNDTDLLLSFILFFECWLLGQDFFHLRMIYYSLHQSSIVFAKNTTALQAAI